MSNTQPTHSIERTSPKGGPFIGKCRLCGTEGLTSGDALKPCPNPGNVSSDDALLGAITGENEKVPTVQEGPLKDWPVWAAEKPVIQLTQRELDALPEYSCTIPDSYKRPIAEGGRPWRRNLNFYGRFGSGDKWVRCEYVPDPDPKFLGIANQRVEVIA